MRNTAEAYGSVAKFFHWLVFFAVLGLLLVGFFMGDLPKSMKGTVYNVHKLTGLTVFTLMILRAVWALLNPKPKLPAGTPGWERAAELGMHFALYAVLLAMPITGWVMSTAADRLPHLFGFSFAMPGIPVLKAMAKEYNNYHEILAWVIVSLVSLHVLAALKHHIIDKDNILRRMMPKKQP